MSIANKLEKLGFGKQAQIRLLTQLYHLVKAGVPAPDALRHMQAAHAKKRNTGLANVCQLMVDNASEGRKIAEGMEDWFSFEVCSILITSEKRGILDEGLENILDYLRSTSDFLKPFKSCTTGAAYLLALCVTIAIIGVQYIPQIGQYSKHWPGITTSLYSTAKFMYYGYPGIIGVLIATVIYIIWSVKNYKRSIRSILAWPFMPLYRAIVSFNILKILALLSANGIGVPEIVETLTLQFRKGYVSECVTQMDRKIRDGEQNMGEVMDTGLFTSAQISELQLISQYVGEENYSTIFRAMASIIKESSSKVIQAIASSFNLFSLLAMAAGVLWVYGAYAMLAASIKS